MAWENLRNIGLASVLVGAAWTASCGGQDKSVDPPPETNGGMTGDAGETGVGNQGPTAAGAGAGGSEAGCAADEDCGRNTPVCDAVSSECVECVFTSDCATGQRCLAGSCVATTSCETSLDCRDEPDGRTICYPTTSQCVECMGAADCPPDNDCTGQLCVPFTACTSSLDCRAGQQVCSRASGRCVECVETADCAEEQVCFGNACRPACSSDNDCTPLGLLCNKLRGHCARCLEHAHCPDTAFCADGDCVPDICRASRTVCEGNAVAVCDAQGSSFLSVTSCGASQSCEQTSSSARCIAPGGSGGTGAGGQGGSGQGGNSEGGLGNTGGSLNLPGTNLITNGDFSNGAVDWDLVGMLTSPPPYTVTAGTLCLDLAAFQSFVVGWPAVTTQAVPILAGRSYTFAFTAWTSEPLSSSTTVASAMVAKVGHVSVPYTPAFERIVSVGATPMTQVLTFTTVSGDTAAGIVFTGFGGALGSRLCLDDIWLSLSD